MGDHVSRAKLLKKIERARNSKAILYVTGDRPGWETQIAADARDRFVDHLDGIEPNGKISLILQTNGGQTLTAWTLVNLIRSYCDEFEVIVPSKAMSAGTLMCLGSDTIIMTKQAVLGPIDPSVNGPLNPMIPGAPPSARAAVSVEAVRGYLEIVTGDLKIKDDHARAQVLIKLSEMVHPLVLGEIFRSRSQIKYLAGRLLKHHLKDQKKAPEIVSFLSADAGSHDYTLNRAEARELGLTVETPSADLYKLIKALYIDYRDELMLNVPYDANALLGANAQVNYFVPRSLVESSWGGSECFVSEGTLTRSAAPAVQLPGFPQGVAIPGMPALVVDDKRTFEGWKKR